MKSFKKKGQVVDMEETPVEEGASIFVIILIAALIILGLLAIYNILKGGSTMDIFAFLR